MAEEDGLTAAERLIRLLEHLGIARAHFLARSPLELVELVRIAPERIASIVLQGGSGRPDAFARVADRMLWLLGDQGDAARVMAGQLAGQPNVHWLRGYGDFAWSNTVADRLEEVASAIQGFLARVEQAEPLTQIEQSGDGEVAELTYRATGHGTPVVLLPLGFAVGQWEPLLPALQANHCTIVLGGSRLQPVAQLETRSDGDYSRMALEILGLAEPKPNESLIEVGCGPGALLRRIVRRYPETRITGLDVNGFLLREARALAEREGVAERIDWREGSAESIPLPDNRFDVTFSSTVMEEVDATRMMAELVRITKPGGRVVVIVRAVDRGQWTNLSLPAAVKAKVEVVRGGVAADGCADESLYRRFADAGLEQIRGGPAWSWVYPADGFWPNQEANTRAMLTPDEAALWDEALAAAKAAGQLIWIARPFHCAVGVKA